MGFHELAMYFNDFLWFKKINKDFIGECIVLWGGPNESGIYTAPWLHLYAIYAAS